MFAHKNGMSLAFGVLHLPRIFRGDTFAPFPPAATAVEDTQQGDQSRCLLLYFVLIREFNG